jgi:hypothetical protein
MEVVVYSDKLGSKQLVEDLSDISDGRGMEVPLRPAPIKFKKKN